MLTITELQAIKESKVLLLECNTKYSGNWTTSNMTKKECEDFIWSYLYNCGLQYKKPIEYVRNNITYCILVHEE